jgi:hypothetical protein
MLCATFAIWKFSWVEEGKVLAKSTEDGYIVGASFRNREERERALANIRATDRGMIDIECPAEPNRDFFPLAQVLPEGMEAELTAMMSGDRMIYEDYISKMATRMEADPDPDYIFQLSPEQYEEAVKLRKRRPS